MQDLQPCSEICNKSLILSPFSKTIKFDHFPGVFSQNEEIDAERSTHQDT